MPNKMPAMTIMQRTFVALGGLSLALVPAIAFSATQTVGANASSWTRPRLTIERGDTVKWTNNSVQTHSFQGYGGNWNKTGILTPQGDPITHKFRAAGTYKYRCTEHSTKFRGEPCEGMCGVVRVKS
jgi:plastocyanin